MQPRQGDRSTSCRCAMQLRQGDKSRRKVLCNLDLKIVFQIDRSLINVLCSQDKEQLMHTWYTIETGHAVILCNQQGSGVGIHKCFGARKKTSSESIFLRIDFKISFFPFLQILFTEKVSVFADVLKKIDLFEKN
jgi:hypothetical protein